MFDDRIFREYDIRGIVGKDFDEDFAFSLGKAFAAHLREAPPVSKKVSGGRDVRHYKNKK